MTAWFCIIAISTASGNFIQPSAVPFEDKTMCAIHCNSTGEALANEFYEREFTVAIGAKCLELQIWQDVTPEEGEN